MTETKTTTARKAAKPAAADTKSPELEALQKDLATAQTQARERGEDLTKAQDQVKALGDDLAAVTKARDEDLAELEDLRAFKAEREAGDRQAEEEAAKAAELLKPAEGLTQAPLALTGMLSRGVSMAEARAKLGMDPLEDTGQEGAD